MAHSHSRVLAVTPLVLQTLPINQAGLTPFTFRGAWCRGYVTTAVGGYS